MLNHDKVQKALVQGSIKWNFNTPAASGGVWECLIHSARSVLTSILQQQILDDEGLQTIFCEVEAKLNYLNDLEALTTNHILMSKGKPILPPGLFDPSDLYMRRWKQIQYIAELFWKRWISESTVHKAQKKSHSWRHCPACGCCRSRGSWLMGKVLDVNKDAKGLVCSVCLQTKTSILERPVMKLCLLLEAAV